MWNRLRPGRGIARVLTAAVAVSLFAAALAQPAWAQDPSGGKTGVAADAQGPGGAVFPSEPTDTSASDYAEQKKAYDEFQANLAKEPVAGALADAVGQNRIAINMVWVLVAGFLVMFMQAGFAMVEAGFCRKKNAAHVLMTNFMIYPIGMLGFYIAGFALMFGAVGAIGSIGGTPPLTTGTELGIPGPNGTTLGFLAWNPGAFFLQNGVYDVGTLAFFLFQMVFMDTTCTIPTGSMAERWKFSAFVVYGFVISTLIYPIFGNWVWGGGWLSQMGKAWGLGNGAADFAGGAVVHMVGGFVALAGAIVLGPRLGKFTNGRPNAMPAHNLPMAMIGTFILAFGWFGFNPGSMLAASGAGSLRIGIVAVVTMLAGAAGAVGAMFYWWAKYKKPDPSMCVNGMLAGLVAITPPSGWVNPTGAMIIGLVAGLLVCVAVPLVEKAGVDDPVGAFSVHGLCGAWGVISVGLFADGTFGGGLNGVSSNVTGIFYGGGAGQLIAQVITVVVCAAWSLGPGFAFFKIQDKVMGIRSSRQDELDGLDVPEMGVEAYPEDPVRPGSSIGGTSSAPLGVPVGAEA